MSTARPKYRVAAVALLVLIASALLPEPARAALPPELGEPPQQPPLIEAGQLSGGTQTATALCRTIRLRSTPADSGYWYQGAADAYAPQPIGTNASAYVSPSSTGSNAIRLYASTTRTGLGPTEAWATGGVGFGFRLTGPAGSIPIQVDLSSNAFGLFDALAVANPFAAGSAEATARAYAKLYGINWSTSQQVGGFSVYDRSAHASTSWLVPAEEDAFEHGYSNAYTVGTLSVDNNQTVTVATYGKVIASVHPEGGASARAIVDFSNESEGRNLAAYYSDWRMMDSSRYWTDNSRCVEYW